MTLKPKVLLVYVCVYTHAHTPAVRYGPSWSPLLGPPPPFQISKCQMSQDLVFDLLSSFSQSHQGPGLSIFALDFQIYISYLVFALSSRFLYPWLSKYLDVV